MGSFSATCCISSLPIEYGDKVRYFLLTESPYKAGWTCSPHDQWSPRTFPLMGIYNDYGSVEKVKKGPERDLWLEVFKTDLIEVGMGDNICHDLAVKKDMTFDEMLSAVWDGRIKVRDRLAAAVYPYVSEAKTPAGVPTMHRIEKVIKSAKLPLAKGTKMALGTKAYIVDSPSAGTVRVRWAGTGVGPGKAGELRKLARLLEDEYAVMVAAGDCSTSELTVRPLPDTENWRGQSIFERGRSKGELLVSQAMIREDVWQSLIGMTVDGEYNLKTSCHTKLTIEDFRKSVKTTLAKYARQKKLAKDLDAEGLPGSLTLERDEDWGVPGGWIISDAIPGVAGLGTHLRAMADKDKVSEKFINTVAEFFMVHKILAYCRYAWMPGGGGPQWGEWIEHERLLSAYLEVAKAKADEVRKKMGNE